MEQQEIWNYPKIILDIVINLIILVIIIITNKELYWNLPISE